MWISITFFIGGVFFLYGHRGRVWLTSNGRIRCLFQFLDPQLSVISPKLHIYSAIAGVALALVSKSLGRGPLLVAAPIALSALCLYSHFGVSAQLNEIRDLSFGPDGAGELAARFGTLHRISLSIFIGVGIAVTALIGLHARADS